MEVLLLAVLLSYMLSTAAYIAYLFLQHAFLQKTGCRLLALGFVLHTLVLLAAFVQTGVLPAGSLPETLSIAAWAVAGVFLGFQTTFNLKILGVYAAPLTTLAMLSASLMPRGTAPPQPIFKSFWLVIHILTVFLGEGAFALACGVGILYLLQERAIKQKNPGFFFKRLPSLELIDATGYGCLVVGFTLLTIGLVTGFVYAKSVWGHFWSWDPKEVWSAVAWVLYAVLLHGRIAAGWRGRQASLMAIVGFAALMFTFFGVNFLLEGHHGEFTRF